MIIERTSKEIIVRIPANIDTADIQDMLDFIQYKEITSKSKASQKDVDALVKKAKKGRLNKIRRRIKK
jgi:hypothetical protein